MLSSIHPLGERVRHNRWALTVAAHLAGSTVGGAATGGLLAGLVAVVRRLTGEPGAGAGLAIAAVAIAVALAADVAGRDRIWPTLRRQVDEGWLTSYRGWVYGAGFGLQLGIGVVTIVTTATVHALWVVTAVQATPLAGALVGGVFGLGRSLPLLAMIGVDHPERLRSFHRRVDEVGGATRRAAAVVLGGLTAVAVLGALAA